MIFYKALPLIYIVHRNRGSVEMLGLVRPRWRDPLYAEWRDAVEAPGPRLHP